MVTDVIAGLSAIKTAFDIAKSLKEINEATVRNAAVIELQDKLLTVQQAQAALVARIEELEKQLARHASWEMEKSRYLLKDFGGGTFAYELLPEHSNGEPLHRICPTCFEKRVKSILQSRGRDAFQREIYDCQGCKSEFRFGQKLNISRPTRANTRYKPFAR